MKVFYINEILLNLFMNFKGVQKLTMANHISSRVLKMPFPPPSPPPHPICLYMFFADKCFAFFGFGLVYRLYYVNVFFHSGDGNIICLCLFLIIWFYISHINPIFPALSLAGSPVMEEQESRTYTFHSSLVCCWVRGRGKAHLYE